MFSKFFLEDTSKHRPAFLTSDGVNLDLIPLKVYTVEYPGGNTDSFHVQQRVTGTHRFYPHLVELPKPTSLWTFFSELRTDVIKLLEFFSLMQFIFQVRTHNRGRTFRTQGYTGILTISKGVHLLFDNVGSLSNTPDE